MLSLLATLLRLIGFIEWADKLYKQHEQNEADNVQSKVNAMDDATVSDKLHKYFRK